MAIAEKIAENEKKSGSASAGLKLAVFGAFILALLSLAGSGWLYQSLNAEMRDRQALEGAQDQIRDKSVNLEKVSESYKSQIEELQVKLQEYENERGQFKQAIEDNRDLIISLQERLKAAEEIKNKALELKAAAEQAVPAGPSENAGGSPSDFSAPPAGAANPAVVALPSTPPVVRAPQVLTVNRKFNFVVVSLGVKDGLQMGDAIEILRQGKPIANVQVEKLYENFAAATIVREPKEDPIKEGDSIRKLSA